MPSKFQSQKPIYDVLIDDAKQYKARQAEVQKIRTKNLEILQSELDKKKKILAERAEEIARNDILEKKGPSFLSHTYVASNASVLAQDLKDSSGKLNENLYTKKKRRENEPTRRLYGKNEKNEFLGTCSRDSFHDTLKVRENFFFCVFSLFFLFFL